MLCNSLLINLNAALKFRGCNFARSPVYVQMCLDTITFVILKSNFAHSRTQMWKIAVT